MKDHRFCIADLSSIETRVGAWMSGCEPLLNVFREGRDSYLDFATKMTGIPYEILDRDIHSKDPDVKSAAKRHRQIAKPGVLGCVYRLSGGGWGTNKYGDTIKTGLWGYAENMGVEMSQEQSHAVVRIFRESYLEIPQMWYALEEAIADVLEPGTTRVKRELGPGGCIKIDKLILNQAPSENVFPQNSVKRCVLRIQLPSGRFLHYMDAEIQEILMPWKDAEGADVYKPSLVYSGVDQETKQWKMGITSHGGKVFENIDQGISRDVLAEKLLLIEAAGIPICGHVHDEGIGETPNDAFSPGVQDMIEIMSRPIEWAPGLPLGADGFEGPYYHK